MPFHYTILKMHKADQPNQVLEQDFSKPWEQSDVILLVEGQQIHVHRVILAMSSPVFSKMFSAEFKEKYAEEIPLPEKIAEEIREMLSVIYPTSWKPVQESNCYFLLALAQEYQMSKLTQMCEDFLLKAVDKKEGAAILETIVVAQRYNLDKVINSCIQKTQHLSLRGLKSHATYKKIGLLTQRKMLDLQMSKIEKKITKMEHLTDKAQTSFDSVVNEIGCHIHTRNVQTSRERKGKRRVAYFHVRPGFSSSQKESLKMIKQDKGGDEGLFGTGVCRPFYDLYSPLKELQKSLLKMTDILQNGTDIDDSGSDSD